MFGARTGEVAPSCLQAPAKVKLAEGFGEVPNGIFEIDPNRISARSSPKMKAAPP
jgi:hypothetical protein